MKVPSFTFKYVALERQCDFINFKVSFSYLGCCDSVILHQTCKVQFLGLLDYNVVDILQKLTRPEKTLSKSMKVWQGYSRT